MENMIHKPEQYLFKKIINGYIRVREIQSNENINNFGVNIHDPNYYSYILNELSKKDYDILFVNNIEKYMITHLCKNS